MENCELTEAQELPTQVQSTQLTNTVQMPKWDSEKRLYTFEDLLWGVATQSVDSLTKIFWQNSTTQKNLPTSLPPAAELMPGVFTLRRKDCSAKFERYPFQYRQASSRRRAQFLAHNTTGFICSLRPPHGQRIKKENAACHLCGELLGCTDKETFFYNSPGSKSAQEQAERTAALLCIIGIVFEFCFNDLRRFPHQNHVVKSSSQAQITTQSSVLQGEKLWFLFPAGLSCDVLSSTNLVPSCKLCLLCLPLN